MERETLEVMFGKLEARPVRYGPDEVARRLDGAALGKELNRLQGYMAGPVEDRIQALYARGQIQFEELVELTLSCSRNGWLQGRFNLER